MLKKFLIGTFFVAAFALVASSASADCSITTTLKVGSKGAEVSCLQTKVGATSDGSFGPLTKASVMAYQSNHALSADGVVGPLSRAVLNAAVNASVTFAPAGCTSASGYSSSLGLAGGLCHVAGTPAAGCQVGWAFDPMTGLSCTGVVNPTPSGVAAEGYMTLQSAPVAVLSSVGQSETGDAVMAFSVKAKGSDIKVQRVNIHLTSPASALPWKYFTNLSLYNDGTLLGTLPVNSTSLTENTFGRDYTAMFDGLNAVIAKDSVANFIVKADIVGTLPATPTTYTIAIDQANAIRGIDGIGLSQYVSDTSAYNRTVSFTASTSGHVTVIANGSNPSVMNVVTSATNVTTGIPALIFDLQNTSKYDVQIKTLTATLGNNNTTVSGYYLYDGATMIMSVGNPGTTTLSFANLPSNFTVAANSTKTLTIKFDVAAAGSGSQTISVANSGITAVDSNSNLLVAGTDLVGSATGLAQTFQATGVVVNLVGTPTIAVTPSTSGATGFTTATFVFTVKANGVNLGKLSTAGYIVATGTNVTSNTNVTYAVSPDTTVSDGSQVTVTMTVAKTTATAGSVTYTIAGITFTDADTTTPHLVNTGLQNFHVTAAYAN